jgi:hypothetical protein
MEKHTQQYPQHLPVGCPMTETAYKQATSCPCPGGIKLLEPFTTQTNLNIGVGNYTPK